MAKEEASSSAPGPSEQLPPPAGGGSGSGGETPRGRRRRAPGDPLLIVCGCFSLVTAATALLCVAVNVLSAVQSFRRNGGDVSPSYLHPPLSAPSPVRRSSGLVVASGAPTRRRHGLIRCPPAGFSDIRGHIPVLRGGDLAVRGRPRDRVGIHHQILQGSMRCPVFSPISLHLTYVQTLGVVQVVGTHRVLFVHCPISDVLWSSLTNKFRNGSSFTCI
jgi:hypothetical protein